MTDTTTERQKLQDLAWANDLAGLAALRQSLIEEGSKLAQRISRADERGTPASLDDALSHMGVVANQVVRASELINIRLGLDEEGDEEGDEDE